jgi:anti-sigma-K factor RskA
MTHQEIKELLPLYVVGGLERESVTAIERHLAEECESCAAELREWQEITGLIPLGVTPEEPSPAIKDRLLGRIRRERSGQGLSPRPRRWRPLIVGAPLAAAAAVLVTFAGLRYQEAIRSAAEQQSRADRVATLLAQEQGKLANREQEMKQLALQVQQQQGVTAEKSQQVAQLESALAEQRQLVGKRDQELTRLQTLLAARTPEAVPTPQPGLSVQTVAGYEREIEGLKTELARAREKITTSERSLQETQTTLAQQHQRVEASTRELAELREAVARQRGVIEVLTAPGLQMRPLQRAKLGLDAEGHVLWNERRKAWLFYAFGMPPAPEGKEYQVWFMTEREGPVSAGLFSPDQAGVGQVLAAPPSKLFGKINAVAVTLEPAGGLPKPSGEMYLRGSL